MKIGYEKILLLGVGLTTSFITGCNSVEDVGEILKQGELSVEVGCKDKTSARPDCEGSFTYRLQVGGIGGGGASQSEKKKQIQEIVEESKDVVYVENGKELKVNGVEITLKDGGLVVDRQIFEGIKLGAEVRVKDPSKIATWASQLYFTSFEVNMLYTFTPIDNFKPLTITRTMLLNSSVIKTSSADIDPLCKFELQGVPACEKRKGGIINQD